MSKRVSHLPDPSYWIRHYIFNELKLYSQNDVAVTSTQTFVPISPSLTQAGEQDFYQSLVQASGLEQPLWMQYDKLMRFRTNPFYRIKKEQIILTINHPDIDIVDNVSTIIEQLLDREDAAAQDLNAWASSSNLGKRFNTFFHKLRVFKVDESRDLVELNSINFAMARSRVIIEFDYHWDDTPQDNDDDSDYSNYK